jgi:hypothetical protein
LALCASLGRAWRAVTLFPEAVPDALVTPKGINSAQNTELNAAHRTNRGVRARPSYVQVTIVIVESPQK